MVKALEHDDTPIINPLISDLPRVSFLCKSIWQKVTSDSTAGSVEPLRPIERRCLAPLGCLVSEQLGDAFILSRRGQWDSTVPSLISLKHEIWNKRSNLVFLQKLPSTYSCWYADYLHFPDHYNMRRLILWLAIPKYKLKPVF